MGNMVEKKKDEVSTVISLKWNKNGENQSNVIEKDYRKTLEEKIQEKILNMTNRGIDKPGISKENVDKKKKWMGELINAMLEVKDILEKTKVIKVDLNNLNKLMIKSIDYDETKIVKTGFRLDIEFSQRSKVLNNKNDCYLVQLLGRDVLQDNMRKYYDIDTLMEFIINYCSEYIAERHISCY
jgi:hypothetical protein